MMNDLENLNQEQYKAATILNGYELMLAGAGTGKTHTLISRVAWMLEQGVYPEQILLLTFTKKAAAEMKDRLVKYAGEAGRRVEAGTFHSFIWKMMQCYQEQLGLPKHMRILDKGDDEILFRTRRKFYLDGSGLSKEECKEFPSVTELLTLISNAVNRMVDIEYEAFQEELESFFNYKDMALELIADYERCKEEEAYYNFDDLMKVWLQALKTNEVLKMQMNRRYMYVLCDEYQDTNLLQDAILKEMTETSGNLCVVGDDNQSIYRFRAAEIENILSFEETHENCQVIALTENYRSTQEILDVSNAMMVHATEGIPKVLHGQTHGNKPAYVMTADDRVAADYIVKAIQYHRRESQVKLSEQCVLVRKALSSWYLEQALIKAKIPFQKFGGKRFVDERNVKVILNILRLTLHPKDAIAWRGVLQEVPGIGPRSVEQLSAAASGAGLAILTNTAQYMRRGMTLQMQLQPVAELLKQLELCSTVSDKISKAGEFYETMLKRQLTKTSSDKEAEKVETRLRDLPNEVATLCDMAGKARSVKQFLDDVTLDEPLNQTNTEVLTISTIHSAKGLEWEHVYILHPVEEVFHDWNASVQDLAEERRVLYVAMTRAKKMLKFVQAESMQLNGRVVLTSMSSFLTPSDVQSTMRFLEYPRRS